MKGGVVSEPRERFGPDAPAAQRRAFLIYYARVLMREAQARRGQNVWWMIEGAARSRREAQAIDTRPPQADLFARGVG